MLTRMRKARWCDSFAHGNSDWPFGCWAIAVVGVQVPGVLGQSEPDAGSY